MWLDIEGNESVFKTRTFGMFAGLYRPSFYIQGPLREQVYRDIDPAKLADSGRKVSVSMVSLKTGKVRYINGTDPLFLDGVLASSAFPVFFEPIKIEGELYTDGGVRDILPIERCYDMGATVVDAVMCSPREAFSCPADPKAIDIFHATIDAMSNEIADGDLRSKARWCIEPRKVLLENSLDFDPHLIRSNIQHGYDVARSQLR
jgi:predicted acylesterase/phospholipase RssA